jgi:hypothetical protein
MVYRSEDIIDQGTSNDRIVGRGICSIARECVCRRRGSFLHEFAQIQEMSRDHIWPTESSGFTHVES